MPTKPSVVFMGSGPVAARSLALLSEYAEIEAVITKPRAAHHKGSVPVLEFAEKNQLVLHTVTSRQELESLVEQHIFNSQLGVLIDFGIIVSAETINSFELGIINSHFSLLPQWRGADPITFAILSGQVTTGVSLMLLVQKMDEGPLLGQATYDIPETATTPELTDDLIELSNALLQELVPRYLRGELIASPQELITQASSKEPTYSRKLTKADGKIDWSKSAVQLEREIRAFAAWPSSQTELHGRRLIITRAHVVDESGQPGDISKDSQVLVVYCGQQALSIDQLKPAGRNEMPATAFLAGLK